MLALQNVSKSFGALTVTDDVSVEVPKGQALGIIGPNGAGKSTLFNLITGNLRADKGAINYQGRDVTHVSAMERCLTGIGRSFQIPQPFEKLTVFENLLVAATHGRNQSEAEVRDACADVLERTELLRRANTPAGRLSLLERKRLELARAMATDPKLLLLDEIAGGLTEGECQALIRHDQRHSRTGRHNHLDRTCAARSDLGGGTPSGARLREGHRDRRPGRDHGVQRGQGNLPGD